MDPLEYMCHSNERTCFISGKGIYWLFIFHHNNLTKKILRHSSQKCHSFCISVCHLFSWCYSYIIIGFLLPLLPTLFLFLWQHWFWQCTHDYFEIIFVLRLWPHIYPCSTCTTFFLALPPLLKYLCVYKSISITTTTIIESQPPLLLSLRHTPSLSTWPTTPPPPPSMIHHHHIHIIYTASTNMLPIPRTTLLSPLHTTLYNAIISIYLNIHWLRLTRSITPIFIYNLHAI